MRSITKGQITITEYEDLDLHDAMLVECFPTIGLVSTIAATYLVSKLNLRPVGSISAPWVAPLAVVYDGRPYPPIRLYAGEKICGIDGDCDQVYVLMSEFTLPDFGVQPLAGAILDWAAERGCRDIISLEGLPAAAPASEEGVPPVPKGPPRVFGVGSTERARKMLEREHVESMGSGVIAGISGTLLWMAEQRGVDAACLLSDAVREFPDARASAALLQIVDGFLKNIDVEIKPLLEQAEALERQIKGAVEAATDAQGSRQPPRPTAFPGMYG
jgi:uncharacterized protein